MWCSGYLPEELLGGTMKLDRPGAAAVGADDRRRRSTCRCQEAAEGIYDIVNENMMGALRLISVQQGYDPREFALVAFGGAGPLHANALGKLLGSWPVIVPPSPGVLCAFGDATTRLRAERARSLTQTFADLGDQRAGRRCSRQLVDEVAPRPRRRGRSARRTGTRCSKPACATAARPSK